MKLLYINLHRDRESPCKQTALLHFSWLVMVFKRLTGKFRTFWHSFQECLQEKESRGLECNRSVSTKLSRRVTAFYGILVSNWLHTLRKSSPRVHCVLIALNAFAKHSCDAVASQCTPKGLRAWPVQLTNITYLLYDLYYLIN